MPSENKTPNLSLNQWEGNEYVKRQDFVDDNLIIDAAVKAAQDKADAAVNNIAKGTSIFAGNGNEVTIPHGLGAVPTSVFAVPISDPEGYLGEVWIRANATNIYVGNSGSFTGVMNWTAIK